jgi:hypothetical protein
MKDYSYVNELLRETVELYVLVDMRSFEPEYSLVDLGDVIAGQTYYTQYQPLTSLRKFTPHQLKYYAQQMKCAVSDLKPMTYQDYMEEIVALRNA